MKKYASILFVLLTALLFITTNTSAQQDASPTDVEETEDNNSIREKVKEKVELARKQPKAYIGSITDITEETLQIKNHEEEICLISISTEKTSFVSVNDTNKDIDFEEVGIGDFIVAMGFIDSETQVLDAKRILISKPLSKINRSVITGNISKIAKRDVIIIDSNGDEITLDFPKRWKGPEVSELEEGQTVIVVGEFENNILALRTIEIMSEPDSSPTPEESEE